MTKATVAAQRSTAICSEAVERIPKLHDGSSATVASEGRTPHRHRGITAGSLILVLGPTGVGKTTLRRKVEETLIEAMRPYLQADPGRIPVLTIEAVAPEAGNFHWRDHFHRMLLAIRRTAH